MSSRSSCSGIESNVHNDMDNDEECLEYSFAPDDGNNDKSIMSSLQPENKRHISFNSTFQQRPNEAVFFVEGRQRSSGIASKIGENRQLSSTNSLNCLQQPHTFQSFSLGSAMYSSQTPNFIKQSQQFSVYSKRLPSGLSSQNGVGTIIDSTRKVQQIRRKRSRSWHLRQKHQQRPLVTQELSRLFHSSETVKVHQHPNRNHKS